MKYREVQEQLRLVGIMISKRGDSIRVNHFSGAPETAYVTSDLQEALRAGLTMARPKHLPANWCAQRHA
ncbi:MULTISPECIES: hypothetical protein [Aminobacter]|uniref:hypothetical protein n=1 Tax=Aminobacter TaxID=31988 RepID=UPI0012AFD640|nr:MULTISPECIES: hypothetical protein [Aminobacter]MCX8571804.1 hypothetical protein [Aminobacter sp. MET-1]MDR7225281.1 hypothetical protein [Aminobacter aminovorans]MRX33988.1 hypothetical protein [Aminobacter sp. MDW-2]QNH33982.1 hypothetical protein H5P29_26565 [Aminobacter sp. MDW-2]